MVDLISWSDNYLLGIDTIDEQHKKFFKVIHDFYMDVLVREGERTLESALGFLKDYALEHFQSEEAFMEEHEYPGIKDHKKLHEEFIDKLGALLEGFDTFGSSQGLADEAADMAQNWLVDHISDVDTRYVEHVGKS